MTIVAPLALAALLYAWGLVRARAAGRPPATAAVAAFALGLLAIAGVLLGPMDELADASLAWHMAQHLVLISIAAPLLLLGAPIRLALAALPPRAAAGLARLLRSAPLRVVAHPAFAWIQLAIVLYAVHFSTLYEAALEHEGIHALEHALFLTSGLVFWSPLLAVAPAPHAPGHPVRLLAIFLAIPMGAFLGFAFYVARHALYPHYAGAPDALADQQNAGAVMWLAGSGPLVVALLWNVADWGARERRLGAAADGSA